MGDASKILIGKLVTHILSRENVNNIFSFYEKIQMLSSPLLVVAAKSTLVLMEVRAAFRKTNSIGFSSSISSHILGVLL